MAERAGIPLTYQKQDIIEGWEGKAKGMEQILWERGWIDPNEDRKSYTVHGKKDSMGAVRKDTSLPTSRTLKPKRQCFNSRPRRWAC
jgi:hypothetical protein